MPDTYDAIIVGARCAGSPNRHAPGRERPQGARRRSVNVSERHRFDSPDPPARRARPRAVGRGRRRPRHRVPADRGVLLRLRPGGPPRHRPDRRRRCHRLRPAPHGARQDPRRRGRQGRRRGARGVHRGGGADGRRRRGRHPWPRRARHLGRGPGAESSSAPTVGAPRSPRPCNRSSTTTSRSCSRASTPTSAISR